MCIVLCKSIPTAVKIQFFSALKESPRSPRLTPPFLPRSFLLNILFSWRSCFHLLYWDLCWSETWWIICCLFSGSGLQISRRDLQHPSSVSVLGGDSALDCAVNVSLWWVFTSLTLHNNLDCHCLLIRYPWCNYRYNALVYLLTIQGALSI